MLQHDESQGHVMWWHGLRLPTAFRHGPLWVLVLFVVMPAAIARADEADDRFAVAANHFAQQRWGLAVEELRTFLDQYPTHAKADDGTFLMAEALLLSGDVAQADTYFRRYLSRQPAGKYARSALFRAGEAAYLSGKMDLARTDLRRFLSENPDDKLNAYVLPYLGDIALGQDDVSSAIRYFRSGLDRFPTGRMQDDCRFGLARALEKEHQDDEAARLYLAVAGKTQSPLADKAQFHLGALQYAAGNYAEAIGTFAAFETDFADSPWKAKARMGRGWALRNVGRLDEAKQWFQSVVSDPTVGVEAQFWLGLTDKAREDWTAAGKTLLAAADRAGPRDPLIQDIRFHAGDALLQAGDTAGAVRQFDLVLASTADGNRWADDALYGKIRAAWEAKDHAGLEAAVAQFDRQCHDSPLAGDVARLHARSLLQRKEHAAAIKILEPLAAVGLADKQGLEDRYLLALAYQGADRTEDALAGLLPVLDAAEGRLKADAQLLQGSLLTAIERWADAVAPLEAFLAAEPAAKLAGETATDAAGEAPGRDDEVRARGELAICYARTKRLDDAKRAYAELLRKYPVHPLLAPATEQLAEAAYAADDATWSAELFRRIGSDPKSPESELKGLSGLGWSQFKEGRWTEASATFDTLLRKQPPADMAVEALIVRGRVLEQLEQFDAALAMYDQVIDKYPEAKQRPEAMLDAARLRDRLQQDQESAALYRRIAEQYPKLPQLDAALYQWAWVCEDLGDHSQATALFERLHGEYPESRYWPDGTFRLAQRSFAAKDYARAKTLVAELLDRKAEPPENTAETSASAAKTPENTAETPETTVGASANESHGQIREHALYLQGQIAAAEEAWPQVRETYQTLATEFPDSPKRLVAEFWVAESVYRQGDYEAAGKLFDLLAQQAQGRSESWLAMIPLRRAQVAAQRKQWNDAYAIASKIEAEFPNFPQQHEADYVIGRCLAARADFDGARKAYRKVIYSSTGEKTETAAMAHWMIGETFFHQEKYAVALREYWQVRILYAFPTWQAAALLQAGKCHEFLHEPDKARELYAELLREFPDTQFAKEASMRLKTPLTQSGQPER